MNLAAFASPLDGDFAALANRLSLQIVRNTDERLASLAQQHGLAVPRSEAAKLDAPLAALRLFSPELSAVRVGLNAVVSRGEVMGRICQLAIAAHVAGVGSETELVVEGQGPIYCGGCVFSGDELVVRADDSLLLIADRHSGVEARLHKVDREGRTPWWARDGATDLARLGSRFDVRLTDSNWWQHWRLGSPSTELTKDVAANRLILEAAGTHLETSTPDYYRWVGTLLCEVFPQIDIGAGGNTSQSYATWFGHLHVSLSTVTRTIKMLLHECSHQYFHLAMHFGPLTRPNAPEAHSVLKGRSRPLEKILLGYHAFANALLALTALREAGAELPSEELDREIYALANLVAELDASLRPLSDEYLEESGKTIYLPLRRRVDELGVVAAA